MRISTPELLNWLISEWELTLKQLDWSNSNSEAFPTCNTELTGEYLVHVNVMTDNISCPTHFPKDKN